MLKVTNIADIKPLFMNNGANINNITSPNN